MMPSADADPELPPIAAIVASARGAADTALRDFVADLRRRGVRVRGLLQESRPDEGGCQHHLVDIESGQRYPISQQLGSQSNACTLDTAALAEATSVLRRIAVEGADLAVFNRYAKLECDGEGFAAEMLQVMSNGIPVLTVTSPAYLESWRHFTGGIARELPPDPAALNDWFAA